MIDSDILDEMDLPLVNLNEELETISKNLLQPMFDVSKFELRSETVRDKGVDLGIEIKKAGKHTNFRFIVQLKASDSIRLNRDGSFSLQIHCSNINYLMNAGIPAFYILYSRSHNKFYYEHLNEFVKSLSEKDSEWGKQQTHTLRFYKELDIIGLNEMYNLALSKGLFQRKINEKIAINSTIKNEDKILFDTNLDVTGDLEIRTLIENIGLTLINEGKWKEIIYVHKKASQNIATTAKYNLVLGLANYYTGNLLDALLFFKYANKLRNELDDDLKAHLDYMDTDVKFYMGIISEEDYRSKIKKIEENPTLSLYIRLNKAKEMYLTVLESDPIEKYDLLENELTDIINDPSVTPSIKLIAKCDLILFQGCKNNIDWVRGISIINAQENIIGPNFELRKNAAINFYQAHTAWYNLVQELKEEALREKNYLAYYSALINELKVSYEIAFYSDHVHVTGATPGIPTPSKPDKRPSLEKMLSKLDEALNYYNLIGHVENMIVALSRKYEILHYLEKMDDANEAIIKMEALVETYDLHNHKENINHLKNNGTSHELFKIWFDGIWNEVNEQKKEFAELVDKMTKLDEEEKTKDLLKDSLQIQLFPIGNFQVPVERKEKMFEILGISNNSTKDQFDYFFSNRITPVANIHVHPVTQEGFGEGIITEKVIECWRNIYRIRKSFFENGFYRIHTPNSYFPK